MLFVTLKFEEYTEYYSNIIKTLGENLVNLALTDEDKFFNFMVQQYGDQTILALLNQYSKEDVKQYLIKQYISGTIEAINKEQFDTSILSLPIAVKKLDPKTKIKIFDSGQKETVIKSILTDYEKNEQIILQGHSAGGGDVQDIAEVLNEKGIQNIITVQIDSVEPFGDDATIPENVSKAINVYQNEAETGNKYIDFLYSGVINGENNIEAKNPSKTMIINQQFTNIQGPATGSPANPHQNMDNDHKVQTFIQNQVIPEVKSEVSK